MKKSLSPSYLKNKISISFILVATNVLLIFWFQNCSGIKAMSSASAVLNYQKSFGTYESRAVAGAPVLGFAAKPAGGIDDALESESSCELRIVNDVIAFGASVRFLSTYTGNSEGVTAYWTGTNQNKGNGYVVTPIEPQLTEVHNEHNLSTLTETDYANTSDLYVGNYTRQLEYRRGNQVLCTTNTIPARFADVGQIVDTPAPPAAPKVPQNPVIREPVQQQSAHDYTCKLRVNSSGQGACIHFSSHAYYTIGVYECSNGALVVVHKYTTDDNGKLNCYATYSSKEAPANQSVVKYSQTGTFKPF